MKVTNKLSLILFLILLTNVLVFPQSTLDCSLCHSDNSNHWAESKHSNTQLDVAEELASEWSGLPADSVIYGATPEDCIACHGATSVSLNGGMSEVNALNYFFSTNNGDFTDTTSALHTEEWPHVNCVTCHDVPSDHPSSLPVISIFNSQDMQYHEVATSSYLCGQCHGSLRFVDTDHLRFDAWQASRHGHGGQVDLSGELAEEWAGSTPDDVISGDEAEDCIACHAPTAILLEGGITETEALTKFFTTTDGKFTESTTVQNTEDWPEVACITCHNPHKPEDISLFDSPTGTFLTFASSQELCGQCHGNLRFPDTDHLSYNIESGTGGIGVSDKITMTGVKCVDCHMIGGEEETLASMYSGHTWSVIVEEEDGSKTAACTKCHSSRDAAKAIMKIDELKNNFTQLDSIANEKLARAEEIILGSSDSIIIKKFNEAQFNLLFAEGDESGGVHNFEYTNALLKDAIDKATEILTGVEGKDSGIPREYRLYQNYPNPFNPATTIKYSIPYSMNRKESSKDLVNVTLGIYDLLGRKVVTILNTEQSPGNYSVEFKANNLSSGIYLYKLKAGDFNSTKKMILMK